MDLAELILSDHDEQRRMFAQLDDVDPADTAALGSLWTRLSAMLEVHALAEERSLHPELLALGRGDRAADHDDIRDGILEAERHEVGSEPWWRGVHATRAANDRHGHAAAPA